jgi:uncharacterized membrane protein YbaN (DUF454 family)
MAPNKAGTRAPGARKRRRRPRTWRRLALWVTGWFCIFLGILGLFLPILQGILFLLIGLFILSLVSPRIRLFRQRLRAKARSRYPKWTGKFEEAELRGSRMVKRILRPSKKRR